MVIEYTKPAANGVDPPKRFRKARAPHLLASQAGGQRTDVDLSQKIRVPDSERVADLIDVLKRRWRKFDTSMVLHRMGMRSPEAPSQTERRAVTGAPETSLFLREDETYYVEQLGEGANRCADIHSRRAPAEVTVTAEMYLGEERVRLVISGGLCASSQPMRRGRRICAYMDGRLPRFVVRRLRECAKRGTRSRPQS